MFSHTVNTERTEGVEKVPLSYSWPERPGNCCKKMGWMAILLHVGNRAQKFSRGVAHAAWPICSSI